MSEAYIQDHYKVITDVYDYMLSQTRDLNPDTRHFVNHVAVCTIQRMTMRADSFSIPISSTLIKGKLKNARVFDATHLLTIKPYSHLGRECREFELQNWYLNGLIAEASKFSAEEYLRVDKVNLFSGQRVRAATKSLLYDEQRHYEPEIITNAIRVIVANGCPFNLKAVEQHLIEMRDTRDSYVRDYGKDDRRSIQAQGRYSNDFFCSRAVLDQNPVSAATDGIYVYCPAYFVALTGRIQQYRGGLQSCSRRMKRVAYSGIPGLRNYDLKSSQINALALELIEANFDPNWLLDYLDTPDAKRVYAEKTGMTVDCWKRCLLALVMGAPLPSTTNEYSVRHYSIMRSLLEEAEGDLDSAERLRRKFAAAVAPLVEQLNNWHRYLVGEFLKVKHKRSKRGEYIENQVGKKLYVSELSLKGPARKAKAKLSAFLLQGREAAFIHALTALGIQYGFEPVNNEHDGLVVIGEIPSEAISRAARMSDFDNAELVEKSFI